MKLREVTGTPFVYLCFQCGQRFQTDREKTMADLDGPAFQAYYCEKCTELNDEQD